MERARKVAEDTFWSALSPTSKAGADQSVVTSDKTERRKLLAVSEREALVCGAKAGLCEAVAHGLSRDVGMAVSSCSIPDDDISPRRSALFMARSVLRDILGEVRAC